jgi:hypothetical protein
MKIFVIAASLLMTSTSLMSVNCYADKENLISYTRYTNKTTAYRVLAWDSEKQVCIDKWDSSYQMPQEATDGPSLSSVVDAKQVNSQKCAGLIVAEKIFALNQGACAQGKIIISPASHTQTNVNDETALTLSESCNCVITQGWQGSESAHFPQLQDKEIQQSAMACKDMYPVELRGKIEAIEKEVKDSL